MSQLSIPLSNYLKARLVHYIIGARLEWTMEGCLAWIDSGKYPHSFIKNCREGSEQGSQLASVEMGNTAKVYIVGEFPSS